jgi:hypothetical protein
LVHEIKAAIAKKGLMTAETRHVAKRKSLEAALAACRAERQRLISENATLLLRALTAEEALARMQRRTPHALKMNVLQTGSAVDRSARAVVPRNSVLPSRKALPEK